MSVTAEKKQNKTWNPTVIQILSRIQIILKMHIFQVKPSLNIQRNPERQFGAQAEEGRIFDFWLPLYT